MSIAPGIVIGAAMLLVQTWRDIRFERSADVKMLRATAILIGECMSGPGRPARCGCSGRFDEDGDGDVDLRDWSAYERRCNGASRLVPELKGLRPWDTGEGNDTQTAGEPTSEDVA